MSFNITNPAPKKTNEKKTKWYEKVWSAISLISLFGEGLIPSKAKDNIPVKWRNIIIIFLILVLAYFIVSGVWFNLIMLIEWSKSLSFGLGDTFYYYGIVAIISVLLSFFDIDNEIERISNQKKAVKKSLKDLGKKKPSELLPNPKDGLNHIGTINGIVGFINSVWVICGIIFYDRWWFAALLGLSIASSIASTIFKKPSMIRIILLEEIAVTIITICIILNNHFLIF